jgi:NADH-quinone oxidoreductase subunit L
MSGEQDMRKMGGLAKYMPVTFWTFLAGTVAIAGIPPLAGFFSKDAILAAAMASGHGTLWLIGVIAAGLTSFYMFRLLFLTFYGECRADEHVRHHLHESPPSMLIPLIVLALLSVVGGWVGLPLHILWGDRFGEFLAPVFGGHTLPHLTGSTEVILMAASVGAALIGFSLALVMYVFRPTLPQQWTQSVPALYRLVLNKYYVDEIYDAAFVRSSLAIAKGLWSWVDVGVIDTAVNGTANTVAATSRIWRRTQTGNVQHYAVMMFFGAMVLLGYYALR